MLLRIYLPSLPSPPMEESPLAWSSVKEALKLDASYWRTHSSSCDNCAIFQQLLILFWKVLCVQLHKPFSARSDWSLTPLANWRAASPSITLLCHFIVLFFEYAWGSRLLYLICSGRVCLSQKERKGLAIRSAELEWRMQSNPSESGRSHSFDWVHTHHYCLVYLIEGAVE